ncbi:hypothetical protein [Ralstonia pseudosolanacearum]|uniref:hypothetical protein n=1 Tax=Ralstonia pseudosolanacearum TaxID=1310165 RepID=UPI003F7A7D26
MQQRRFVPPTASLAASNVFDQGAEKYRIRAAFEARETPWRQRATGGANGGRSKVN